MRKILLLSDTHSYIDDQILKYVKMADEVWHAGDIGDLKVLDTISKLKPVRAVYGNIDNVEARRAYPLDQTFFVERVAVWMTHIGGYPGRYKQRVRERMELFNPKPKLFICGHSHILKVVYDKKNGLLHMNPGAAGKHGIHKVRTMLRFVVDDTEIKDLEVIELEQRQ